MELFITILQLICGLIVIGIVLFQSGKSAGLSGAIGRRGRFLYGEEQGQEHGCQARPRDKWVGAAFIVLTLVLNML